ncbi:MAG TPA: tRNA lysidine(34) synthetase TilS [Streptosporangiaceae bacterium]|nr:tRNA lysidine(34) synthetase TilS [Streptosporangiaceae bacterium]
MGPDPAVAAVRLGVRRSLTGLTSRESGPGGPLVLVACSGGPDSLALGAAAAFEAPRLGVRAGAVTVDHGLQEGSAEQAWRVAATLRGLGLDPVACVRADVAGRGAGGQYPGPEAAARHARYAVIEAAAVELGATAVLLGHTMDDQAETVLLGLARGSGARSLAGMAGASGRYLRPLLGLRRAQTVAACAAQDLRPWDDPQNADDAYARTRVRRRILPLMEELLGPGVTEALARTADQLRADADALDDVAADAADRLLAADGGMEVTALAALPAAIRTRLLRRAAIAAGTPAGSLTAAHIAQLDALVTAWHGQRWSDLPGGIRCVRRYGRLQFTTG